METSKNCPECGSTAEEKITKEKGPHKGEYCGVCGHFYRWVPKSIEEFIWPIGSKHKGKPILEILKTDKAYLIWAADSISAPNLRKKAQEALNTSAPPNTTPSTPKLVLTRKPTGSTRNSTEDDSPPWDV